MHSESRCKPADLILIQYSGTAFMAIASARSMIFLPVLFVCEWLFFIYTNYNYKFVPSAFCYKKWHWMISF